jgi:type II secretory pathway component PulK
MFRSNQAKSGEEGVVLLLILGLIVITIGSVYAFARVSLLEVMSSVQRQAHVRASLLARSGVEIGMRALVDDLFMADEVLSTSLEMPVDPWRILSQTPIELPEEAGSLRITIRDSGSRISLNALVDLQGELHQDSKPFLMAALERLIDDMPGREEEKLYEIEELADGILDWLDSDDQTRLGDDEATYYERQGSESLPVDRPLFSLDELSAVPGMDDLLLEALKSYFTPHPMFPEDKSGGVNPNTAPPHILGMIYHGIAQEKQLLDQEEVFRILQAREEGKVFCSPEYGEECTSFSELMGFAGENDFPPLQYESDIFSIRSVARIGDARACVTTVVNRSDLEAPQTLLYRMDC